MFYSYLLLKKREAISFSTSEIYKGWKLDIRYWPSRVVSYKFTILKRYSASLRKMWKLDKNNCNITHVLINFYADLNSIVGQKVHIVTWALPDVAQVMQPIAPILEFESISIFKYPLNRSPDYLNLHNLSSVMLNTHTHTKHLHIWTIRRRKKRCLTCIRRMQLSQSNGSGYWKRFSKKSLDHRDRQCSMSAAVRLWLHLLFLSEIGGFSGVVKT